ncbi:Small G protein signaling modulator 1 [Thelohanellus kitauei]|uniref:Small G protein signaling modulator 1 n=1 Tax=Thelohanellus kitauei TaxID=669202 RepID=A0A0C2NIZ4_THEKT|nr:Small G protein signaling modulator 1 [Thelohanellus kitauei]
MNDYKLEHIYNSHRKQCHDTIHLETNEPQPPQWEMIERDVKRCDKHIAFFTKDINTNKLSNILLGMADLLAPILYIVENGKYLECSEVNSYTCFNEFMKKMWPRFPKNLHQNIFNEIMFEMIKVKEN